MEILPYKPKTSTSKSNVEKNSAPISSYSKHKAEFVSKFKPIEMGKSSTKTLNTGVEGTIKKLTPATSKTFHDLLKDPLGLKTSKPKNFFKDVAKSFSDSWVNLFEDFSGGKGKHEITNITEGVGHAIHTAGEAGMAIFSPITALFAGAEDVPVLSSVAKLVSLPVVIATDIADDTIVPMANKVIDSTDMSQANKETFKEGIKSVVDLVAGFAGGEMAYKGAGKVSKVLGEVKSEVKEAKTLTSAFGEMDANTIETWAGKLYKQRIEKDLANDIAKTAEEITVEKPFSMNDVPADRQKFYKKNNFSEDLIKKSEENIVKQGYKETAKEPIKLTTSEISKKAINSFENEPVGIKEKSTQFYKEHPEEITKEPVQIRIIDGKTYLEDGRHRLQAAKDLGIEDLKFEDVSKRYEQPAKEGVSKSSKRMGAGEEALKYNKSDTVSRKKYAGEIAKTDYELGKKMIRGEEQLPEGFLPGDILGAMEEEAIAKNDWQTIKELKTSPLHLEGVKAGQIAQSFDSINGESALSAIEEVAQSREKTYNEKGGETVKKITKSKLEKFINNLECK